MNSKTVALKQKTGYISNFRLVMFAFATAFFPRLLDVAGAPSVVNFFHFFSVSVAFIVVIKTTRIRDRDQIIISRLLLSGLMILFGVMTASAFWNNAGVINLVLDFLLLAEPYMLLLAIISLPISRHTLKYFRRWIVTCCMLNLVLAYIQLPLLNAGLLPRGSLGISDAVQGVFYLTTAGNYVSASVSICFGLYYFASAKTIPLWFRIFIVFACGWQLIISDAKQIILALIAAGALLVLVNYQKPLKLFSYLIATGVSLYAFYWCIQNVEAFSAFSSWLKRTDLFGLDGAATQVKIAAFRIVPTYYESPVNWFLGLGPGHTVGRLGGWMLEQYSDLLIPLGATTHPVSKATWVAIYQSWVAKESTMFSPFFGWAGIWGDLGFLGLAAYLYLASLVWRYLCRDDLSRFWLLSIFIIGLIFTQMEEPGYMLSMAMFIGLRWQERQFLIRQRKQRYTAF